MKYFVFIALLCQSFFSFAQTSKSTVADGDWFNPQIWSPPGVPSIVSDSISIDHEVTLSVTLELDIAHLIIGSKGILDCDSSLLLHGSMWVDGELYVYEDFAIGDGGYTTNHGAIEVGEFLNTNDATENYGTIEAEFLPVSEPFLNATGGVIEAVEFITGDFTLVNNGTIFTYDWMHGSIANGAGSICIESCFQNNGDIGGTLDICDLTPGGGLPCDFNFGTIAAGVTMCVNSACAPTSVESNQENIALKLFPNPLHSGQSLTLEIGMTDAFDVQIIDQLGRVVTSYNQVRQSTVEISSRLKRGVYYVRILHENVTFTQQKLVVY